MNEKTMDAIHTILVTPPAQQKTVALGIVQSLDFDDNENAETVTAIKTVINMLLSKGEAIHVMLETAAATRFLAVELSNEDKEKLAMGVASMLLAPIEDIEGILNRIDPLLIEVSNAVKMAQAIADITGEHGVTDSR